jgi:hypothetical protein
MVLTEDAAQVTAAEEDTARAVVSCDAGFFAKVRADDVYFDGRGANETVAGLLVAINAAKARTQVAVAEVGVGERALARGIDGGDEVIAGDVVVKEEGWSEMEGTFGLGQVGLGGWWRAYRWAECMSQTR